MAAVCDVCSYLYTTAMLMFQILVAFVALMLAAKALLLLDYAHAASHGGSTHSGTLLSHIIHHEDGGIADTQDLRDWTRRLVKTSREDTRFVDYTYPQYGDAAAGGQSVDVDGLVDYLVEEKGFNREDLEFLSHNLDYGLIEKELQKIKSRQGPTDLNIEIGGEAPIAEPDKKPIFSPDVEASGTKPSFSLAALLVVVAYIM